jgi:hypothetical protein
MTNQFYLPLQKEVLYLPEPQFQLTDWMIDLLDEAHENAFHVMVEQMKINPDAIEALYGTGEP